MINLDFGLFYSGAPMSYLRYLCFKTLRHFHPKSRIQLFTTTKYVKQGHSWNREKQDFEGDYSPINYMDRLKDLNVDIVTMNGFAENYHPVAQSDIFRYWWLKNNGGFYLDTDQIVLNSFETLPLNKDLIYSVYPNPQCGIYAPVGVLGSPKDSKIMEYITNHILDYYSPNNYNSSGPFMFLDVLRKFNLNNSYNAPSDIFYPAFNSDKVVDIYTGQLVIPSNSLALHWFGGHYVSQSFNKAYTEEFAKTSDDTISKKVRELNLL